MLHGTVFDMVTNTNLMTVQTLLGISNTKKKKKNLY
jgi:hypothetical protein